MRLIGPRLARLASSLALVASSFTAARPAIAQTHKELRIAAAADLQPVMPALANLYEKATGVKLVVNFGSSGVLETQIENGAPVDLFMGADFTFPEKVVAAGLADAKAPTAYAQGKLVIWAPKNSPLQPINIDKVTDARVQKIAIANPERAPYGRAAMSALEHMDLIGAVRGKLVTGENVAQAAEFAASGNAQVALISLTLAKSPRYDQIGGYDRVPQSQYPEIRQTAIVLARSDRKAEAHAFLTWLLSQDVQSKLPNVGLEPVR